VFLGGFDFHVVGVFLWFFLVVLDLLDVFSHLFSFSLTKAGVSLRNGWFAGYGGLPVFLQVSSLGLVGLVGPAWCFLTSGLLMV